MRFETLDNSIQLTFPASNTGKFRFKTRDNRIGFGATFATRKNSFNENVYLEWQIGYDVITTDYEAGIKHTNLTQISFVGANGKNKYLYELSEILYEALSIGLVTIDEIDSLLEEVTSYEEFIDEKEIIVEEHCSPNVNEFPFVETSIKLPTLFAIQDSDGTQIEVSIQKQQYASGVQPMIYFCIPFNSFINWNELNGRSSLRGDKLKYIIDKSNIVVILSMFKIFGMSSQRHKHDISQILATIKTLFENY